jgi:hypothetical protein
MSLSRVSAFCLSLSFAALTGSASVAHSFDFVGDAPAVSSPGHREWAWDGDHHLYLGVPATLHYQRGGPARIVITGPEDQLRRVQVGGGHIERDDDWNWHGDDEKLDITVSGVALDHISLGGSGRILLGHLDQDALDLDIGGSGNVAADGRIEHLKVNIGGSGRVAFDKVASADAHVRVAGSGNIALASANELDVVIAGSGQIRLAARPAHLHSTVMGSGRVVVTDKDGVTTDLLTREHGMSRVDY